MEKPAPFRLGFIGCGSYSGSLASAASRTERLAIAACYDPVAVSAASFASAYGAEVCASLEELLARPDVEGVVIASPNNAHPANARAAAGAGKGIFVDKPIANTISGAKEIIAAADAAGVVLAVGHNGRRMPGHRKMKKMLDEGAIGTPVTVESNFSHSGGLGLTPSQWRSYRDQCPALPLMQLGIHFADTVQYLLGDVLEVSSFMSHIATPADNEDVTVSLLRFDGGLLGYLGSNYASPSVYYVNVYGTEGNLYCEGGGQLFLRKAGTGERVSVALQPSDSQIEELEEFARCCRQGTRPEVDGQAGLKALAVVRAALHSHSQKRPVSISEILAGDAGEAD